MADESEDQWLYGDSVDGKEPQADQSGTVNSENEAANDPRENTSIPSELLPFADGPPGVNTVPNLNLKFV